MRELSLRGTSTLLVGGLLLAACLAAWLAMASRAGTGMAGGMSASALPAYLWAWLVMMTAMMLPSALPMVLLFHRASSPAHSPQRTAILVAGYLFLWGAAGVPAYGLQWLLARSSLPTDRLPWLLAAVLLIAGAYQLSPLKGACLRHCRSPLDFLVQHWRAGAAGALRLGVAHGAYCIGCCWGLMAILVAAGVMGLHWVLLVAAVVFVEKVLPWGEASSRLVGLLLLGLGLLVALQPQLATAVTPFMG